MLKNSSFFCSFQLIAETFETDLKLSFQFLVDIIFDRSHEDDTLRKRKMFHRFFFLFILIFFFYFSFHSRFFFPSHPFFFVFVTEINFFFQEDSSEVSTRSVGVFGRWLWSLFSLFCLYTKINIFRGKSFKFLSFSFGKTFTGKTKTSWRFSFFFPSFQCLIFTSKWMSLLYLMLNLTLLRMMWAEL